MATSSSKASSSKLSRQEISQLSLDGSGILSTVLFLLWDTMSPVSSSTINCTAARRCNRSDSWCASFSLSFQHSSSSTSPVPRISRASKRCISWVLVSTIPNHESRTAANLLIPSLQPIRPQLSLFPHRRRGLPYLSSCFSTRLQCCYWKIGRPLCQYLVQLHRHTDEVLHRSVVRSCWYALHLALRSGHHWSRSPWTGATMGIPQDRPRRSVPWCCRASSPLECLGELDGCC